MPALEDRVLGKPRQASQRNTRKAGRAIGGIVGTPEAGVISPPRSWGGHGEKRLLAAGAVGLDLA